MIRTCFALACAFWLPLHAQAATIRVGPQEKITRIAHAAKIARDGDVVEIQPGIYPGDVAVWRQKNLRIVGLGQGPVLDAQGRIAEGKAIWVIANGNVHISNVSFQGARAPHRNGAGIRFERGRLTLDHCRFQDNQMSLLTSNHPDAELVIRNSFFSRAPRQDDVLPHLLYIGRIASVTVSGSRFEHAYRGHLIKSRARRTDLRYNLIYDGPNGAASYEVDLPNGGDAVLVGNIVGQSAQTRNTAIVSYGAEGAHWPANRLRMAHNTLINEHTPSSRFVQVWRDRVPGVSVEFLNNLWIGPGALDAGPQAKMAGNASAPLQQLNARHALAFDLPRHALDADGAVPLLGAHAELTPNAQFKLPWGVRPRHDGARAMAGALPPKN